MFHDILSYGTPCTCNNRTKIDAATQNISPDDDVRMDPIMENSSTETVSPLDYTPFHQPSWSPSGIAQLVGSHALTSSTGNYECTDNFSHAPLPNSVPFYTVPVPIQPERALDMNNPLALEFFLQLRIFRDTSPQTELLFHDLDLSKQLVLCTLAKQLGLDYYFDRKIRQARVSRPRQSPMPDINDESMVGTMMPIPRPIIRPLIPVAEENASSTTSTAFPQYLQSTSNLIWTSGDSQPQYRPIKSFNPMDEEQSFNYLSPTDAGASFSEGFSVSRPTSSRSSSVTSISSSRSRDRAWRYFMRRPSVESVSQLKANGLLLASQLNDPARPVSAPPGRRGPLSEVARASARAVKALKACWRCKILRKGCDTENHCNKCPKGETKSNWKAIGCRRGTLKDEIERITFCPQVYSAASSSVMTSKLLSTTRNQGEKEGSSETSPFISIYSTGPPENGPRAAQNTLIYNIEKTVPGDPNSGIFGLGCVADESAFEFEDLVDLSDGMSISNCKNLQHDTIDLADTVNQHGMESNKRRQKEVERLSNSINSAITMTTDMPIPNADLWTSSIPLSLFQKLITNSKSVNGPLWSCVLAIVWELFEAPGPQLTIETMAKEELVLLLTSAARYQMESEGDQLIAQSLTCLLNCLQTLRLQTSGQLTAHSHRNCEPPHCNIDCMSDLDMTIGLYIDEFSNVIFRKENLQNDRRWWLSMFYSLCIQSIVRKGLIEITEGVSLQQGAPTNSGPRLYLHLALRLFIACAATYDPITIDWNSASVSTSASTQEASQAPQYKLAQRAVGQHTWGSSGINGSPDYLKQLFEHRDISEIHSTVLESSNLPFEQEYATINSTHSIVSYGSFNEVSDGTQSSMKLRRRSTTRSRNQSRRRTSSLGSFCRPPTAQNPAVHVYSTSTYAYGRNSLQSSNRQISPNLSHDPSFGLQYQQQASDSPSSNENTPWNTTVLPSHPYHDHHQPDLPRSLHVDGISSAQLAKSNRLSFNDAEISDSPDVWAALYEEQMTPSWEDLRPTDPELVPYSQRPIFLQTFIDHYTPHWLRGHGTEHQGWCGICKPGLWLNIENQDFENHKILIHGVAKTGRLLPEPKELRQTERDPDLWEALCANCSQWVTLWKDHDRLVPWFGHAHSCNAL